MTNKRIDVDGTTASQVVSVNYESTEGGDIGQATISVGNTASNRSLFTPGALVEVYYEDPSNPGTFVKDWTGEVIGNPSNQSKRNLTLDVEAETKIAQIEYGKVNRPFIEYDSGAIVREAVEKVVEPYTRPAYVTTCDDLTNWDSDATYFELTDARSKKLAEFGSNTFFVAATQGESGTFRVTYDGVDFGDAPGRRILKAETRMLVNNGGNIFTGEVELRDHDGISYVWELDIPGYGGFNTYELPVDEAEQIGSDVGDLDLDGSLEFRFTSDGELPEDRAIAIDMFRTVPFALNDRGTGLSTAGVENTGRTVTRRFESASILEVANTIASEEGAVVYIDDNDNLIFESAGDTHVDPSLNIIDDDSPPVVAVDVDRDYDVRNRVTVQGKGDLQETFEDPSSIQFYGGGNATPKQEPIVDKSLRTRDQLEYRARGFLRDNAWQDSAIEFTLGSAAWREATVGQAIDVKWDSEGVSRSTFTIDRVGSTPEGYVVVGVSGNTTA